MKKSKTRIVLIGLIILTLGSIYLLNLFVSQDNPHTEFIARQKIFGIIQKKYTDTISELQQILVNGKKHYVDKGFYNQLNIGDSVSKKLYEFNAIIYKTDGRTIQYDLINTKKQ